MPGSTRVAGQKLRGQLFGGCLDLPELQDRSSGVNFFFGGGLPGSAGAAGQKRTQPHPPCSVYLGYYPSCVPVLHELIDDVINLSARYDAISVEIVATEDALNLLLLVLSHGRWLLWRHPAATALVTSGKVKVREKGRGAGKGPGATGEPLCACLYQARATIYLAS